MSQVIRTAPMAQQLKFGLIVACSVMVLAGCNRSDTQEKVKETTTTQTTKTTTKVEKKPTVDCTNPAVSTAIAETLKAQIAQTSANTLINVGQQANVTLDNAALQNSLNQISVNMDNLHGSDSQCQANIAITLPQDAINNANRVFTRLQEPTLDNKAMALGYRLQDNMLMADNQVFDITPANGLYQVSLARSQNMIQLTSDVMANATLGKVMGTVRRSANTATATAPKRSAETANQRKAPQETARVSERQTPRAERDNRNNERQVTARANTKPQTQTNEATATTTTTKPATNTTTTTKPTTATAPSTPDTKPVERKPAETSNKATSTGNQPVPSDGDLKLSIEEKNEKY